MVFFSLSLVPLYVAFGFITFGSGSRQNPSLNEKKVYFLSSNNKTTTTRQDNTHTKIAKFSLLHSYVQPSINRCVWKTDSNRPISAHEQRTLFFTSIFPFLSRFRHFFCHSFKLFERRKKPFSAHTVSIHNHRHNWKHNQTTRVIIENLNNIHRWTAKKWNRRQKKVTTKHKYTHTWREVTSKETPS